MPLAVFVAGCGGRLDPLAAHRALNRDDVAAAKAINVQTGDLPPGYRVLRVERRGRLPCRPDLSDLTVTGLDDSPVFVTADKFSSVIGSVRIFKTTAQAADEFVRIAGRARRICLLADARRLLRALPSGAVRLTPLRLPPTGITETGFRFTETWVVNDIHRVNYNDAIYLNDRRVFALLSIVNYGRPFSLAREYKLVKTIARRSLQCADDHCVHPR